MITGFIIFAIKSDNEYSYISNTSPILWSNNFNDAKLFYTEYNAKGELEDNFISLSATIQYSNIKSIYIAKYENGVELKRVKFL